MKRLLWLIPIAAIIGLDQLTKWLVVNVLGLDQKGEPITVIGGVLDFTYHENTGMALGLLDQKDERWIFMVASTIAIIAILIVMFVYYKRFYNPLLYTGLAFIAGGGIGNMIDRTILGYVVDFIDFQPLIPFWKWIFNVADAFVCVGSALVIIQVLVSDFKESRKNKTGDHSSQN